MPIVTELPVGRPKRVQIPGDFHRHEDGRPRVAHPTELIKDGTRGRWVYYGRPSGIGKDLENPYALTKWRERRLMLGAGDPNVAQMIRQLEELEYDGPEWRRLADRITIAAAKAGRATEAADRGTHAHALTEDDDLPDDDDGEQRDIIARIEAGEELGIPRHVQLALVTAWRRMLDEYGIEILAVELAVVHDAWEHAGTLDRIGRLTRAITFDWRGGTMTLPAGTIIVLDLKAGRIRFDPKTGQIKFWRTYVTQIACYAGSCIYDTATDTRHPFPWPVDQNWAIIAHLPVLEAMEGTATCRLVLCDIAAGRDAIEAMVLPMTAWQKRQDLLGMTHPDEPTITVDVNNEPNEMSIQRDTRDGLRTMVEERTIASMDSSDAFDGLDGNTPWAQQLGPPTMRRFLSARIKNLANTPKALDEFVAAMDRLNIPRLSRCDTHTNAELRKIEQELVRTECRWGIDSYDVTTPPVDIPDEGADLTATDVNELSPRYKALDPDRKTIVDTWASEARQAGFEVHLSARQTERRRTNLLARIACADPNIDPLLVRAAIAKVTYEDWPHLNSIPLGACFGALTIAQANALIAMVPSLAERTYQFDPTGSLQMVA